VGRAVYVGRCHERHDQHTLLIGVDMHEENGSGRGEDGRTNEEFLDRAAKLGVWGKLDKVVLETAKIESLIPLNEYYTGQSARTEEAIPPSPQGRIRSGACFP
jgi:hypothetical protein